MNNWSLVAILTSLRIELRKVYLSFQRGLLELPSSSSSPLPSDWFFRQVLEGIPLQLRRSYRIESILPNPRLRKKLTDPDGQVMCLLEEIRSCLTYEDDEKELESSSNTDVLLFLLQSVKEIDARIVRECDEIEAKYGDIIPFGNLSCKDWLGNKQQRFPVPKN
jgi:hypothetical protein